VFDIAIRVLHGLMREFFFVDKDGVLSFCIFYEVVIGVMILYAM
jgi:hypothetical protein